MTDLLVDIGNTALKARLSGQGDAIYCRTGNNGELDLRPLKVLANPDRILVASVGHSERLTALVKFCQATWPQAPVWQAQTTASAASVNCAYDEPSRLGIDRWLAVLAAASEPTIVADAGTALTIDWVKPGQHLGGWIVAGLALQSQTLLSKATNISKVSPNTNVKAAAPKDTAKAIADGSLAALLGALELAKSDSRFSGMSPRLWLTGGDAQTLLRAGATGWEHQHELVFAGLEQLASAHQPSTHSCWKPASS